MRASTIGAAALTLGIFLAAAPAYAGDEVAAQALFDEAKKLAADGKYAEACPKFAESNKLDRGAGTMIHLADCYEKNKQSASAWATFKEAASAAQAINRKDWEKLSNDRANALEKKLAHLTIKVDPANDPAKTEVTRDNNPVAAASWNLAIPIDVGPHPVEAKAAGFKTFTTTVNIGKDGENVDFTIPKLEPETATAPTPDPATNPPVTSQPVAPPPDADKGDGGSQRTIGFVIAGIGVAGVAVGAITGLMAIGKANDAKTACGDRDGGCANKTGVDASDSAKTLGTISTIGFIAGGVGLAAGAVLVFTAPKKTGSVRILPNASPQNAGLTVLGAF
jgi:hypothetical protein